MTDRPNRRRGLLYEELPEENELMLVSEEDEQVKVLNSGAGAVWILCNGCRTAAEIAEEICRTIPRCREDEVLRQVVLTIEFLQAEGLLE